ncbi:subtype B tannase [Sulfurimonas sp.]|uniref:subtype B tannase n=1 Tax=Sulfurimonas sp. TaxID=2022749 RepID=UPI003D11DB99
MTKAFYKTILFFLCGALFPSLLSASYDLTFSLNKYTIKTFNLNGKEIKYRAFENIVYVKNPVDIKFQSMNFYVPEAYYAGKKIRDFTKDTAPIFLPNEVGGYMPGSSEVPGISKFTNQPNATIVALSKGYVVASPAARGRILKDKDGHFTGKAPAAIVDLKAAVRYLRYNDKVMPGDALKIISNGTSAGGALSVLLGASGNNKDYEPYLKALGAAEANDDIFAVSAYCPITNLEHADMAYEWQFNGVDDYKKISMEMLDFKMQRQEFAGTLSEKEKEISNKLKPLFPTYLNSLKLKTKDGTQLSLDENGNGTFKEYVKSFVIASAQKELDKGQNLSSLKWLSIKNSKVIDIDFEQYVKYMGRMKTPPAFDALDLKSGENNLFGTSSVDNMHFTDFSKQNDTVGGQSASKEIVKMMNPMEYIHARWTDTTKYWRIRHGSIDKDTSLAISVMLATKLQNDGKVVDLAFPWGKPHSGDYDLDELFAWMDDISKHKVWDKSYGGVDKSYDDKLLTMRDKIAPKFKRLQFKDKITGKTMDYNLYIPKNYDSKKSYPLVLFMADASTTGKGIWSPLMQGYGGIIWATVESQAEHPSFVLVPAFAGPDNVTHDDWSVSDELGIALRLLKDTVSKYSIDKDRLYTTGQSMGGMISFYLNANYPDLFAASIFVGSQWDINVLNPLTKKKFFYIVSKGDEKASKGMKELGDMFKSKGIEFGYTKFDATLSDEQKEEKIQDLLSYGYSRNFVQFTEDTVTPKDESGPGGEHMYSFDYAYQLKSVRDWLFKQSKKKFDRNEKARTVFNTALNYFNGDIVKQDYKKAKELLELATKQGDMKAPRYLGVLYQEGLGIKIDYKKALTFYKEGVKRGDITSAEKIGILYEKGLGVKQSYQDALKWYLVAAPSPEEASKNIHPRIHAVQRLGYFYENGLGVKQDKEEAKKWYAIFLHRRVKHID